MERRSFIKNGMFGALGLQLPAHAFTLFHQPASDVSADFRQFARLCESQKKLLWLMPETLRRRIDAYNQSVSALGFGPNGLRVYVTDHEQFCFYPLWQPIGATGEKVLIVPVFCKDATGNWYKSAVLNQYELASIAAITNDKTLRFKPDHTNLLPLGITAGTQGDAVYKTTDGGFWKVKTICASDAITCTALFFQPDGAVRAAHELRSFNQMI